MHDVSTIFVEDLQYYEVKVIQPRNRDLFLLSSVDTHSLCDKVIRKRLCWSLSLDWNLQVLRAHGSPEVLDIK